MALGSDGTLRRYEQGICYQPEKVIRRDSQEAVGPLPEMPLAIMQNFLDCIRSGKETDCPLEIGFRVSIAYRMAVESYRQGRTVRWDAAKQEIV